MARPYNRDLFDPPAPVITVRLFHPSQSPLSAAVEMQLDSGSDITCIPSGITAIIPHLRSGRLKAKDFDGETSMKCTRFVGIRIDDVEFPAVEAVEINGDVGLLGRDILNQFELTLDGKKLQFNLGKNQ